MLVRLSANIQWGSVYTTGISLRNKSATLYINRQSATVYTEQCFIKPQSLLILQALKTSIKLCHQQFSNILSTTNQYRVLTITNFKMKLQFTLKNSTCKIYRLKNFVLWSIVRKNAKVVPPTPSVSLDIPSAQV